MAGLLDLRTYWRDSTANPDHDLPRGMVALLTSYFVGGAAYLTGRCNNNWGYLALGCNGHFPYH